MSAQTFGPVAYAAQRASAPLASRARAPAPRRASVVPKAKLALDAAEGDDHSSARLGRGAA